MTQTNFQKYLCVDPSFFCSIKRFNELPKVLQKMKQSDSEIVLPSLLKPLLKNMRESDNVNYPSDYDVLELLKKWNPKIYPNRKIKYRKRND